MKKLTEILSQKGVTAQKLGQDGGAFTVEIGNSTFCVIASFGGNWDHVSVSIYGKDRCPKWSEMCIVKDLFFRDYETVIEYHPAKRDYVNDHPYTLHLWRPQCELVPTPPKIMV